MKESCSRLPSNRKLLDSGYNPFRDNEYTLNVVQLISRLGVLATRSRDSNGGNKKDPQNNFPLVSSETISSLAFINLLKS